MSILNKKHLHFIGIGGIGTSSLAQILHEKGKNISGSDCSDSEIIQSLKKSGIKITLNHNPSSIAKKHQAIIYSPAIPADNPELKQAKKLKIPCLSYPEALGELTKNYYTIAITGTHGKSTTTAMTSLTLRNAKLDPTVVIGTKLTEFKNKNYRVGKSKYLVIEACEYKRSFLNFHPKILLITNIEADHLDYYKDLKDYKKAFKEIAKKIPKDGKIIVNSDDQNSLDVTKGSRAEIIILQIESHKIPKLKSAKIYQLKGNILTTPDNKKVKINPAIPGEFNVKNAANAAIIGLELAASIENIEKTIKTYKGSWRRLEFKTTKLQKTKFIDDYGHHPTEVRLTLGAIREKNPDSRILCIFQPHQYSRTRLLLKDFGTAFNAVDAIIIPNIYRSRDSEEDIKKMSTDLLVAEINSHNPNAKNGKTLEETAAYLKAHHKNFDIVVTMGAGDISKIYSLI